MHTVSEIERLVFEQIASGFERDGYQFVQNKEVDIPKGSLRYQPDFVAQKGNQFIAIEIKARRTASGERSLSRIKQDIESDINWKFQVFYADEVLDPKPLSKSDNETLLKIIKEAERAADEGYLNAAFLLSWGAFESAARINHSKIFSKPQTPGRMITILSERGEITADHAQQLRLLAQVRNNLIHGEFGINVQKSDVKFMTNIISRLNAPN